MSRGEVRFLRNVKYKCQSRPYSVQLQKDTSLFSDKSIDDEDGGVGVEGPCNGSHEALRLLESHDRIHVRHHDARSSPADTTELCVLRASRNWGPTEMLNTNSAYW